MAPPALQGSTWVFTTYFQPFLLKNQADIDANIAAVQTNTLAFLQSRLQVFWQTFWDLATKSAASNQARAPGAPQSGAPGGQQQQPAASGANYVELARSLWTSYGSSLIGAAKQAASPATGAQPVSASASRPAASPAAASPYDVASSSSVQVNQNAFSSEMVNNFSPAASSTHLPPPFPEPQVAPSQ